MALKRRAKESGAAQAGVETQAQTAYRVAVVHRSIAERPGTVVRDQKTRVDLAVELEIGAVVTDPQRWNPRVAGGSSANCRRQSCKRQKSSRCSRHFPARSCGPDVFRQIALILARRERQRDTE